MALNDVYQITLVFNLNGRECCNTLFYLEEIATATAPFFVAGQITEEVYDNIWLTHWKPFLSADSRLMAIAGQMIWPTVHEAWVTPLADEPGAISEESIPNGSCALISYKGANPIQNFWRRIYLSGLPVSAVENSLLVQSYLDQVAGLATRIRTFLPSTPATPTASFGPVAFSTALSLEAGPTPYSVLDQQTVKRNIRSQRQRNVVVST